MPTSNSSRTNNAKGTKKASASRARTTSSKTPQATRSNANAELLGKIDAINKSMAVIEFELDGTIVTANDNFLNVVGYTLEEIQGQHHSIFVEPDYKNSPDYKQFWEALNRGEYQTAEYKRIGKRGKEVWIQASYNPILDKNGTPLKVVKFATDVTEQKVAQMTALAEVNRLIDSTKNGKLDDRADPAIRRTRSKSWPIRWARSPTAI